MRILCQGVPLGVFNKLCRQTGLTSLFVWVFSSFLTLGPSGAIAKSYPVESIRIVVPYAAGGIADRLARLVGVRLEPLLKQSIVVENRSGANGTIAQQYVAQSKADGYTLLLGNTGTQVVNRVLYPNFSVDLATAFDPIGMIAITPMLLVVANNSPLNNIKDVIDAARAAPGKIDFGSAGNGSLSHVALALLNAQAGVNIAHVPYRGTSQVIPDLLGGRLTGYFDVPATAFGPINAKSLKPIGIASLKRLAVLPDVPTIAETLPGFEATTWLGLFSPMGTPSDRIEKLNKALNQVLQEPEFSKLLVEQGNEIRLMTPSQFGAFINEEAKRMQQLAQSAGIRPE